MKRMKALLILFGMAIPAFSDVTPPTYVYDLTLPSISGGLEDDSSFTSYSFSFAGPFVFDQAPGAFCPAVCGPDILGSSVKPGYTFYGFINTSGAGPTAFDPEIQVLFSDNSGAVDSSGSNFYTSNTVTFTFIEPDSFWSTPGAQSFAAVDYPGEGASYSIGGTDPPCFECSMTTSISSPTPSSPTPEPGYLFPAMAGMAGLAAMRFRRRTP
jgi:hypothetical protein